MAACYPSFAAAATLPEPALRLSPAIATPGSGFPAEERALLRVEYRAAQTQAAEADIVGDILGRVRHMDDMIRDIRDLVERLPASGEQLRLSTPPVSRRAARHRPAQAGGGSAHGRWRTSGWNIPGPAGLMASVIVFLFWLLGKRHSYIKAQRLKAAATLMPRLRPHLKTRCPSLRRKARRWPRTPRTRLPPGRPWRRRRRAPRPPPHGRSHPKHSLIPRTRSRTTVASNLLAPLDFETIAASARRRPPTHRKHIDAPIEAGHRPVAGTGRDHGVDGIWPRAPRMP